MNWADILIVAVLVIAALKGFKRGFVQELSGFLALAASLVTPWFYHGSLDGFFVKAFHLGTGAAHIVAMFLVGLLTYIAIIWIARILGAIAKLPVLGLGNAAFGAVVGMAKGLLAIWLALYIALFFPLSPDVRTDLHRSALVAYITQPNDRIDGDIIRTFPWFARPFLHHFFAQHRV